MRQRDISHDGPPSAHPASVGSRLLLELERLARWSVGQLAHPRTRTAVIGCLLILIGAILVSAPFWSFLCVVIGLVMVLVTWVGSRLEGRFAIEWSDGGAGFEMRARFKAMSAPATLAAENSTGSTAGAENQETVEGEAHTIELNLDELKALIAAVDQADPVPASSPQESTASVTPDGRDDAEPVSAHPAS